MSQPNDNQPISNAVSAGVYYGVTALVILVIAASVISARVMYSRRMRRAARQRNDMERADAARRGEAAGLPLYNDPGRTVPVPTLAYPDPAYHGTNQPQDPALPGYDVAMAPPKYEYATAAAATTTNGGHNQPDTGLTTQQSSPQPPASHEPDTPTAAVQRPVEMQQTRSASFLTGQHRVTAATVLPPSVSSSQSARQGQTQQPPDGQAQGDGTEGPTSDSRDGAPRVEQLDDATMHVVPLNDDGTHGLTDRATTMPGRTSTSATDTGEHW